MLPTTASKWKCRSNPHLSRFRYPIDPLDKGADPSDRSRTDLNLARKCSSPGVRSGYSLI